MRHSLWMGLLLYASLAAAQRETLEAVISKAPKSVIDQTLKSWAPCSSDLAARLRDRYDSEQWTQTKWGDRELTCLVWDAYRRSRAFAPSVRHRGFYDSTGNAVIRDPLVVVLYHLNAADFPEVLRVLHLMRSEPGIKSLYEKVQALYAANQRGSGEVRLGR